MKRDMDLVRKILLALEANPPGKPIQKLEGVEKMEFVQHIIWLTQADLIEGKGAIGINPPGSSWGMATALTWQGCEFADAMRDEPLWEKAKAKFMRPGISFTLDIVKDWLKSEISKGLSTLSG